MNDARRSGPLTCTLIGILLGLVWKWSFFRFADTVYIQIPIEHDFFPSPMRDAIVLRIAYLASAAGFLVALLFAHVRPTWDLFRTLACAIGTFASAVMLVHQGSYNDVTFLMVVWCGAFATWYSSRLRHDDSNHLQDKALRLSRIILSVMFLGGLVGKCTPEYWSGQVLYEIYFVDRDFWFFNWMRIRYDGEALRSIATVYSRLVIVVEIFGALNWFVGEFIGSRFAAWSAIAILLSIGVTSNFLLFSVLAPLIGLATIGVQNRPTARIG
ncbi:hypothetical protein [Neorhodopirellula pilleata]|uniref:Uncharacterized protein n=1 Tax=Neorhodopirellula pilleata TaxID=2714738 RepID=A0A5C5ZUW1_9BACT|nr:hypothetical protein [Neorhodopirellula pilleata]TWT91354.1 hypothetical protein Pla100_52020 [Neorhodopirellula pilleata]